MNACQHHTGTACALGRFGGHPSAGSCTACDLHVVALTVHGTRPRRRRRQCATALARYARAWLRAEWSLLRDGPVAADVEASRLAQCSACPHALRRARDRKPLACRACGCAPKGPRSRLGIKVQIPTLRCPASPPRWLEAPGTGRLIHWPRLARLALQMLAHVAASAAHHWRRCRAQD